MSDELHSEPTPSEAAVLEVGMVLGLGHAFGLVAGRCSAAQAQSIRRLREDKLFKTCCEKWEDFCQKYLKMSRTEADRTIRTLDEFGPTYFELSQLTRVSPETYRAIAPAIADGMLHFNGDAIPLDADHSRKLASAIAEMRSALPKKSSEEPGLTRQVDLLLEATELEDRLSKLEKCGVVLVQEFEKMAGQMTLATSQMFLKSALMRVRSELDRVAIEIGAV
jgi:hypothetical protein